MAEKVIGILGGMGPEAAVDIFHRIVKSTPARKDQEHLRILIDNNPKVPDRQEAILKGGPSSAPEMIKMARGLERQGAELLIIACNTAHYYLSEVRASVQVPVLSIIEETLDAVRRQVPGIRAVGILMSAGLARVGIYQEAFRNADIEPLVPQGPDLEEVQRIIYRVKEGSHGDGELTALRAVMASLMRRGAQAMALGCTELPVLCKGHTFDVPVIDGNQVLAEAAVREAGKAD
ncbi:MAG: amino acid racemase [Deltaproteobacteria bacterium]|nr:amino acid racemase [Deltaproteobacteria bacterium]MBW2307173.1 amino acid racemase [Deltaproteobacteria bacterium]